MPVEARPFAGQSPDVALASEPAIETDMSAKGEKRLSRKKAAQKQQPVQQKTVTMCKATGPMVKAVQGQLDPLTDCIVKRPQANGQDAFQPAVREVCNKSNSCEGGLQQVEGALLLN